MRIESLIVSRGERVFVHGPSGSGKSTLLGLIAGIHLPRRGSVLIQGRDTRSLSRGGRDALRGAEMGFVFQQFNLLPYLSVVDNVLLPLTFDARAVGRRAGARRSAFSSAWGWRPRWNVHRVRSASGSSSGSP